MAIFEDYLGDLDCSNSYDWVKDKPKQVAQSREYKKREIESLKNKSKAIIQSTFSKYPKKLIDILADNNNMQMENIEEYCSKYSLDKGLQLFPWIFLGNNTEKLITELSVIAQDINFLSSYSGKYYSINTISSKSELINPDPSSSLHIINIEVIIDRKSYKISLVFRRNYSSKLAFYNSTDDHNIKKIFERFTQAEVTIKSMTADKDLLRLKSIERFVKECRKDTGKLIFCGEND